MHNATEINLVINDVTAISIFLLIFIEHCLIVHFAPEIKKFIKVKIYKDKPFRGLNGQ